MPAIKSVKDILMEMGFNPASPTQTQIAFVKHLIKAAKDLEPTVQKQHESQVKLDQRPVQLEFNIPNDKRVS